MKAWLKGGIIGGILLGVYSFLDLYRIYFPGMRITLPINLKPIIFVFSLDPSGVIAGFVVNIILYSIIGFLIGSLIGWLISKYLVKNK
jgi:hypothetical protein